MAVSAVLPPHAPLRLPPEGPYVGLTAFDDDDAAPFFFGRAAEQRIVATNLMTSRLTLVYGPTGVGKSSMLRAGVARRLRLEAEASVSAGRMPQSIGLVFHNWRDEPLPALVRALERTLEAVLGPLMPEPPEPAEDLAGVLEGWTARLAERARALEDETGMRQPSQPELLMILDQFEEYFLYEPDAGCARTFADEFPRAVNRRGLPANFAIAIREDAYTLLDRFEGEIPNVFGNNIRLEHLDRAAAERAIREPVELYAQLSDAPVPERVDDALIRVVLSEIRAGLALGQTGAGRVEGADEEERYETAFLQLVMKAIWASARGNGDKALKLKTLKRLGGAEQIADRHLTAAVEALDPRLRTAAARVFSRLVTPSRAKIAYVASDLAKQDRLPIEDVQAVIDLMVGARILRTVHPAPNSKETRYEIFHDVLAPAMLDWSSKLEDLEEQRRLRREAARARRALMGLVAALALLAVAGAAVYWAVQTQKDADEANVKLAVGKQVSAATGLLDTDPGEALRIAVAAAGPDVRGDAREVLRRAALASRATVVIRGDGRPVSALAFSPGGKRIAIVRSGGGVEIRDAKTAAPIAGVPGTGRVVAAAFSPDGSGLALQRAGERVMVWDAATGRPVYAGPRGKALALALGPQGRRVAVATRGGVEVWSAAGRESSRPMRLRAATLTFDPAGKAVAAALGDGSVRLLRARDGHSLHRFKTLSWMTSGYVSPNDTSYAPRVRFSPDGSMIAIAGVDQATDTYNAHTYDKLGTERSRADITSLAFARGGRLVIGGSNGRAEISRPGTHAAPVELSGHSDAISGIGVSSDGAWIATASSDDTARVWSATNGAPLAELRGHRDRVAIVAFDHDANRIATAADDGSVRLWRAPGDQAAVTLARRSEPVGHVRFSRDGKSVLVTAADGSATVVSPSGTGRHRLLRDRVYPGGFGIDALALVSLFEPRAAISPGGTRSVVAGRARGGLFELPSGRLVQRFAGSSYGASAVAGVGAGRAQGVITTRHGAQVFDLRTGAVTGKLPGAMDYGRLASSVGDHGRYVAAAGIESAVVHVWDFKSGHPVRRDLRPGGSYIGPVALDPSGGHVAAVSDTKLTVWELPSGRRVRTLDLGTNARRVAFSPGGRYLAVVDFGSSVRLWDVKHGWHKSVLRGHSAPINMIAFAPRRPLVATASDDGSVRVWTPAGDLQALIRPRWHGPVLDAEFSPDGSRIGVAGARGAAEIYDCPLCGGPRQLYAYAKDHRPLSR